MFNANVFEGFGVSKDEVSDFKENHVGFCRVDKTRISEFLLIQLAAIAKHRIYDSFSITDVIQELEGVGRGCKPRFSKFKHPPLNKFFKTHFIDARFLVGNLINHWGLEFDDSPKLNNLISQLAQNNEGEWIIFARHNELNYYLCISNHSKSTLDDERLYDFLKLLCAHEYPFLLPELNP